jgi:site-specific DNA recombinase
MSIPQFFKTEFDALASNGVIGHPKGQPAFGYLRVSSAGQADEGRSGLPRQMMHIHEVAFENRLKISWQHIFADDDSGFEFNTRPNLSRLRTAYKSSTRQAHAVVIEDLDRLSRNADWHQGFLLDEMKQYGVETLFWKKFSSRIERAVMGAIAQDGMEQAKRRMAEGNIHKAKSGRVTARVPAFGYKLVDSKGREGENAKKDSHYAIREDEAQIVRLIYKQAIQGHPLRGLARMLQEKYPPPRKATTWEGRAIFNMIKNPAYKGEFAANRRTEVKVPVTVNTGSLTGPVVKMVKKRVARPKEEWIIVPVPAIVSKEEWDLANKLLRTNRKTSKRSGKSPYLLTGLIRCDYCGYNYSGHRRVYKRKDGKETIISSYGCNSKSSRMPAFKERVQCNSSHISMKVLDPAVWEVVHQVLLDPQILINALKKEFMGERNEQTSRQIDFLESQIRATQSEDEKLYKAYMAGVFDEIEFAERRKLVKKKAEKLNQELAKLNGSLISPENFEARKQTILLVCRTAQENGLAKNAPIDIQRRIIKTVVEKITLNVKENWFELEGIIQGRYPIRPNKE